MCGCLCERVRARVPAVRCVCMRVSVSTAELSCVRRVGREQFALAQLRIRTGTADRQADSQEGTGEKRQRERESRRRLRRSQQK